VKLLFPITLSMFVINNEDQYLSLKMNSRQDFLILSALSDFLGLATVTKSSNLIPHRIDEKSASSRVIGRGGILVKI